MIHSRIASTHMRLVLTLVAVILLLPGLVFGFSKGKKAPVLPEDLVKLLPTEMHGLAVAGSIGELDAKLAYLAEDPDDPLAEPPSLGKLLTELLDGCEGCVALDQPVAVTLALPAMIAGSDPLYTLILPWLGTDEQILALTEATEIITTARSGQYVALSVDPYYESAEVVPDLAKDFPVNLFTARLDLDTIMENLRPLAEMGLGALVMSASAPAEEDANGTEGPHSKNFGMSLEEAQALVELARGVMDSLHRLQWSLASKDEEFSLGVVVTVKPDSPLAPGPQLPFKDALELTRFLPANEQLVQATAVNKIKQFDLFMDYYRLNMKRELAKLDDQVGPQSLAWLDSYIDLMTLYFQPYAAAISFEDEAWRVSMVLQSDDAALDLERMAALLDTYPDLGLGVTLATQTSPGTGIRAWQIDVDESRLTELATESHSYKGNTSDVQQLSRILASMENNIYLAAVDNYLLMSMDRGPETMLEIIKATGKRRSAVDPRVAKAAKQAGPDCQMVSVGELGALIDWVLVTMLGAGGDDAESEQGLKEPLPFVETVSIDSQNYIVDLTVPEASVKSLIQEAHKLDK